MKQTEETTLDALEEEIKKAKADARNEGKKVAVLLATGSFSPIHRQHVTMFDIAAKWLEREHGIRVVMGVLSPSCDAYVTAKLRKEAIKFSERSEMARLAVEEHARRTAGGGGGNGVRIVVDTWEGTQPFFVDFPDVHEHLTRAVRARFRDDVWGVLFLCGIDHFERCGLGSGFIPCVAVQRPPYQTRAASDPRRGVFVCNTADIEGADVSSTEMRKRREKHEPIDDLTFSSVADHLRKIGWI